MKDERRCMTGERHAEILDTAAFLKHSRSNVHEAKNTEKGPDVLYPSVEAKKPIVYNTEGLTFPDRKPGRGHRTQVTGNVERQIRPFFRQVTCIPDMTALAEAELFGFGWDGRKRSEEDQEDMGKVPIEDKSRMERKKRMQRILLKKTTKRQVWASFTW